MFWSTTGSVLVLVLAACHLYDHHHRGLPGVVRKRSIGAGSAVNAAYLASMVSGRTWGDFDDRRVGDPLRTPPSAPPSATMRGRPEGASCPRRRPTRATLATGLTGLVGAVRPQPLTGPAAPRA